MIEDHGDPSVDARWRQRLQPPLAGAPERIQFARYRASIEACNAILPPSTQTRIATAARFAHNGHHELAARERAAAGYR